MHRTFNVTEDGAEETAQYSTLAGDGGDLSILTPCEFLAVIIGPKPDEPADIGKTHKKRPEAIAPASLDVARNTFGQGKFQSGAGIGEQCKLRIAAQGSENTDAQIGNHELVAAILAT